MLRQRAEMGAARITIAARPGCYVSSDKRATGVKGKSWEGSVVSMQTSYGILVYRLIAEFELADCYPLFSLTVNQSDDSSGKRFRRVVPMHGELGCHVTKSS